MSLDDDLRRVKEKMAALPSHRDSEGRPPSDPVAWRPPAPEAAVAAWEAGHGVALPADYRAFITRVAGSGDWPHHGLIGLDATVVEPLSTAGGMVRCRGELWRARTEAGSMAVGEVGTVLALEGITLLICRGTDSQKS